MNHAPSVWSRVEPALAEERLPLLQVVAAQLVEDDEDGELDARRPAVGAGAAGRRAGRVRLVATAWVPTTSANSGRSVRGRRA